MSDVSVCEAVVAAALLPWLFFRVLSLTHFAPALPPFSASCRPPSLPPPRFRSPVQGQAADQTARAVLSVPQAPDCGISLSLSLSLCLSLSLSLSLSQ